MKSENIAPAAIQYFPLDQLYLSDMNPRQDADPEGIDLLADSLAMSGLMQNLSGLMDKEGRVAIVAGGRRLRAIGRAIERDPEIIKHRPELAAIPVRLAPDIDTARNWANTENIAREDLHPADEIRAYGRMKDSGASVSAIARTFGKTDAHVYRRLALANLPAPVIDALKAGEISYGMAAAFTVSNDTDLTLAVLEQIKGRDISEHRIKQTLQPDAISDSDRRVKFIGLEVYEAAGGTLTRDLFSDTVLLHDPDLIDRLFTEKLHSEAANAAEGWKWFEIITDSYVPYGTAEKLARLYPVEGVLTEEQTERYDELAYLSDADSLSEAGEAELERLLDIMRGEYTEEQRPHSGWFIYVNNRGVLHREGPYIRPEDKAAAIEAGILVGFAAQSGHSGTSADEVKSPISNALRDDLHRIAQGARQHAALRDPDLLRDLLAYQLSHDLNWRKPLALATEAVTIQPTTGSEGYTLDDRLTPADRGNMFNKDLAKSFRAWRKKGADHIQAELTRALARLLRGSDEQLAALIDKETVPSIRENWIPTAANFFSRVGGPYLETIWRELLDLTDAHPTATSFAKLKKGEKAAKLEALFSDADLRSALGVTDAQAARIDAWLPEGMK